MFAHTDECRAAGLPFAATRPSIGAAPSGDEIRRLVDGAAYLFSNDTSRDLILSRPAGPMPTSWAGGSRITTLGAKSVDLVGANGTDSTHRGGAETAQVDPDRVGDASGPDPSPPRQRSGPRTLGATRLTGRGARVGDHGTQNWTWDLGAAKERLADAYGPGAAVEIAGALSDSSRS